jgi:hypothetical protein
LTYKLIKAVNIYNSAYEANKKKKGKPVDKLKNKDIIDVSSVDNSMYPGIYCIKTCKREKKDYKAAIGKYIKLTSDNSKKKNKSAKELTSDSKDPVSVEWTLTKDAKIYKSEKLSGNGVTLKKDYVVKIKTTKKDNVYQIEYYKKKKDGNKVTKHKDYYISIKDDDLDKKVEKKENDGIDPDIMEKFTIIYGDTASSTVTNKSYKKGLEGLKVQNIRGVFGSPCQFLPAVDARIDATTSGSISAGKDNSIGRLYADKIIKQMPLLLITPGNPSFMTSFSKDQKSTIISKLLGDNNDEDVNALLESGNGKYYSLKYAYTDYYYYVNAMLRAAVYFLGIENETIDNKKLGSFQWMNYSSDPGGDASENIKGNIFGGKGLNTFLGPYAGCIAFYADCGSSVDDSFSNSTTQSTLASSLNGLSDAGREMNFLVGNISATLGNAFGLTELTGQDKALKEITDMSGTVDDILGKGNIISKIISKAGTLLAGGKMVFPELWSDSSFSRSYSCKMKLVSPSGDKLSIFLNILVPIYHLLALTLPRQSGTDQSYYSPFLVRAYCQSMFNVDMGIITDLSITKGAEGEWTKDGLPTVAEVSFSIKDMYESLFMSTAGIGSSGIMSNISELDYIANSCGINVNDQEIGRTIKMYIALNFTGNIKDRIQIGIFGNIAQYFNQKLNNLFGVF